MTPAEFQASVRTLGAQLAGAASFKRLEDLSKCNHQSLVNISQAIDKADASAHVTSYRSVDNRRWNLSVSSLFAEKFDGVDAVYEDDEFWTLVFVACRHVPALKEKLMEHAVSELARRSEDEL